MKKCLGPTGTLIRPWIKVLIWDQKNIFLIITVNRDLTMYLFSFTFPIAGEELIKEMVMSSVFGVPLSVSATMTAYRLMIQRVTKVAQVHNLKSKTVADGRKNIFRGTGLWAFWFQSVFAEKIGPVHTKTLLFMLVSDTAVVIRGFPFLWSAKSLNTKQRGLPVSFWKEKDFNFTNRKCTCS